MRKINFHPGVRIALTNCVRTGGFIVFSRQKSIHHTRSHTLGAQHYRHRRREILAVSDLNMEEKVRKRLGPAGFQIQRVLIIVTQIRFDRSRHVIASTRFGLHDYFPG